MHRLTAEEINSLLSGLSVLRLFEFVANDDCSIYSLSVTLSEDKDLESRTVKVEFEGVSQLAVSGFGGGLTQILIVRVRDIRARGWDRAYFQVDELERGSLSSLCESFRVI
jgi:hypothetical protein